MARRRAQLIAIAAAALVVTPAGGAAGRSLPRVLTLQSAGGVVPGMTPEQVSARWGIAVESVEEVTEGCATASIDTGGVKGYALFEEGRFGAVFLERGVRTPDGIHIGSTVADLRRAYGARLRSEPHAYVPGGRYLSLVQRSPTRRIRFDTNGAGRVTQIAFGGNAARYIEGCA